jgi:hypothetical protein
LADFNLPIPAADAMERLKPGNALLQEEQNYPAAELERTVQGGEANLTQSQRAVTDAVMNSVEHVPKLFFLQGPAGTGKTFVENYLLAKVLAAGKIALAVASSGIAALLLQGGRTAHSRFKIPVKNLTEGTTLSVSKQSALADLYRKTDLIIWDEAQMQHRHCAEAVSRCFQDVRDDPRPFGGVTVLFAGDWAQTLPVIHRGKEADIANACLYSSPLWPQVTRLELHENMRLRRPGITAQEAEEVLQFANWLKSVGRGDDRDEKNNITIPDYIRLITGPDGLKELTLQTYADVYSRPIDMNDHGLLEWFGKRALLAGKNTDVNAVNADMLANMPGEARAYKSADCIPRTTESTYAGTVTTEYLNALEFPGIPLHDTQLKVGAPVMLMRNLDPSSGLCNGTRMIIVRMGQRVLEAKIITGDKRGEIVLIPRIALDCDDKELPFTLRRLQFPIKLAFALTINKSQGQSLESVGIDLSADVFGHGQLYVALSRATNFSNISILLPTPKHRLRQTVNVVFKSVIQRAQL